MKTLSPHSLQWVKMALEIFCLLAAIGLLIKEIILWYYKYYRFLS